MSRRLLRYLLSWRRVWVCGSIFNLLVLVALVLLYRAEDRRGQQAWDVYREAARSRGARIDLADFAMEPIPAEENFAAVEMFVEAFQNPSAPPEARAFYLPLRKTMPALSSLERREQTALSEWQNFFVETKILDLPGADPAADVLQAVNKRFGPAWEQLQEGSKRARCRFPVQWEQGFFAEIPHSRILYGAAHIGGLRVSAHLAIGRSDLALADIETLLRTYNHLRSDLSLLLGLVRSAMVAQVCSSIWEGTGRGWQDSELAELASALPKLAIFSDYENTVASERALLNLWYDQLVAAPILQRKELLRGTTEDHLFPELHGADVKLLARWLPGWMPRGWYRQNQLVANRCVEALLARVDPLLERISLNEETPASAEWLQRDGSKLFSFLFCLSAPMYAQTEKQFVLRHTLVQQTVTGVALERFRNARGAYPERLDELMPEFLKELPVECFNGLPLVYRQAETGGYELYSRALNKVDDGGATRPAKSALMQPDWVWPCPDRSAVRTSTPGVPTATKNQSLDRPFAPR